MSLKPVFIIVAVLRDLVDLLQVQRVSQVDQYEVISDRGAVLLAQNKRTELILHSSTSVDAVGWEDDTLKQVKEMGTFTHFHSIEARSLEVTIALLKHVAVTEEFLIDNDRGKLMRSTDLVSMRTDSQKAFLIP